MKKLNAAKISLFVNIILTTFLAIVAELFAPLKEGLTQIGGHHWTGKGIVAFVAFFAIYALIPERKEAEGNDWIIVATALIGAILIFGYFTLHYMNA
jgi:hypothetical protein